MGVHSVPTPVSDALRAPRPHPSLSWTQSKHKPDPITFTSLKALHWLPQILTFNPTQSSQTGFPRTPVCQGECIRVLPGKKSSPLEFSWKTLGFMILFCFVFLLQFLSELVRDSTVV